MRKSNVKLGPGKEDWTVVRRSGFLRRSRQILREAGALIVKCLRQVGTPAKRVGRSGDHRRPSRTSGAERRRMQGEAPPARRIGSRGLGRTCRWHARQQAQPGHEWRAAADNFTRDQPSDATIAQLLRQHAFRIAQSGDPVDALAGVIDLVIGSDADPYHLIGVLAEGALQTLAHRISNERRRDTAMALMQLMRDRLQFARME